MIIAIDGPAASGKGTLARALAKELNYAYLDTGALYRCVAKTVLEQGSSPEDEALAVEAATALSGSITPDMLADPALRTDEVAQATSKISALPAVRAALLDVQRDFARNPGQNIENRPYEGAVLDGRDIGTVVCPDAPVKLFVSADLEERANRRTKELQSRGIDATYGAVLADMQARDARDQGRSAAPLKPSEDAIILDTTDLSEAEVLDQALQIVRKVS